MPANIWPKERDDELKRLYALVPRLSSSEIAVELNCGITRNSVIGRVHRLGLALRGNVKARPKVKKIRKRTPQATIRIVHNIEADELRCVDIDPRGISLIDLEPGDCRYPDGDGPFTFCGHPAFDGSSYCGPHFDLTRKSSRTIDEAVTEARRKRIRGINFRRSLLESIA
jgi:GcrA cell cycle regulator